MDRVLAIAVALAFAAAICAGGCDADEDADDDAVDDDVGDDDSADDGPVDADGDGHDSTDDCDDTDPAVHPGAEPICDGIDDNDCDGSVDLNEVDDDGDGYSECDGDCAEYNAAVHPDAEQTCDDGIIDNDCDGIIDANETDADGDGYNECAGDCDDTDDVVHPAMYDVEDGLDNDCDGTVDEDVIDCETVPTTPISETIIDGARGYHGLALDSLGYIVGSDTTSLIRSDYQGTWSILQPNAGPCEQMVYLPDGDLVVVNTNINMLMRVDPAGIPTPLAAAGGAYGLIFGPDEMLYTAGGNSVRRIDPVTGDSETVTTIPQGEAHTVAFNGDASRMYIGTIGAGRLYLVDLDENLEPIGAPLVFANFGGWHDGIAADACGHIFVADYSSSSMYRVSPDGDVATFVNWGNNGYGHGLAWGSGIDGWREDALYVPLPYNNNRVKEVVVGVPSHTWGGTVHNAP